MLFLTEKTYCSSKFFAILSAVFLHPLIHGSSGFTSITHGQNHSSSTAHNITSCKNHRNIRLHGFVIHNDRSPFGNFEASHRLRNKRIGGNTHTYHHLDTSIVDISAPVSVIVAASEIFVPANSTTINIKTFKKVVLLM